ncbi:SMI1/KNR4 family protein [Oceanicoccus sp. KOV_DT_Chl]|uniref:SMI1/KNR4 family protein n=1 Tax=Oceanicoccus sp. KOV_DT_Chl TaxID=1904639 RepID=UPI000C7CD57A|nr:SMI1/KNR4 family protein [Oceanicoccus sp. KOV_DT_Chl]
MDRVIEELRANSEAVPVPLELPDMDDIIDAEEQILVSLDYAFRQFLLTVSDVIVGSMEPVTVADPNSHTYLPEVAAVAWSLGLPRDMIPLCEYRGGYYCTNEDGEVHYWLDGEMSNDEPWRDVWVWAEHVWLNS